MITTAIRVAAAAGLGGMAGLLGGLFGVGGTDPNGKPVIYSPALEELQEESCVMDGGLRYIEHSSASIR